MGKLERKKEAKLIHPNSRKATALVKKNIRTARRETRRQQGHRHLRLLAERLVWFRDHLDAEKQKYSVQEAHELIERYITRQEAEAVRLRGAAVPRGPAGRRPRASPRLEAILAAQREEAGQFSQAGFECVDLTSEEAVLWLRTWDGQVKLVPQIKMHKFIRGRLADPAESSASKDDREMAADVDETPPPADDDSGMSDG